jgi:glutathione S-transferase
MKLHFNPGSPFVRKVMVVALECGLANRIEQIPLVLTPVNPDAGVNADNPLGKIPALSLDSGETLYDSRVICEYLNDLGDGSFYPSGAARWTALRQQACADGICDAAILARYEGFVRPEEKRWSDWSDAQLDKCRRALAALESERLGNDLDIGTLSIVIALDYLDFRFPQLDWRGTCPSLKAWYQQFDNHESLLATKPHELKL